MWASYTHFPSTNSGHATSIKDRYISRSRGSVITYQFEFQEIYRGKMSGRRRARLADSWAAGCASSFRCASSVTGGLQPQCRGVLRYVQAPHHRHQRGCLNSWPPRVDWGAGGGCVPEPAQGARPDLKPSLLPCLATARDTPLCEIFCTLPSN